MDQNEERPPPVERPDPYGIDASATTTIGILRKVLMKVIWQLYKTKFKQFVVAFGVDKHYELIKKQASWYKINQTWDPVGRSIGN